ncbi:MAG: hypothetical protein Fur0044_30530 [Anaerolineae bacterium]|nr:hypothetical protein [Anaerolineae bacterium]
MGEILQLVGPPNRLGRLYHTLVVPSNHLCIISQVSLTYLKGKGLTDLMLFSQVGRILHYFITFVESLGEN